MSDYILTYGGSLEHHGISGMKWGKRNGPPYPLSAGAHSSAERKAGTKGWTSEAKKMSDEDLRKAINRKRLENQYHQYNAKTGINKTVNDNTRLVGKTAKTAGKVAGAVSETSKFVGQKDIDKIDDSDMSKKEKKAAKKELKTVQVADKANSVSTIANNVGNSISKNNIVIDPGADLSKMSDAELRKMVDRMALEIQYDELYKPRGGKEVVEDILDTVGDVAGIAVSAVALYKVLKPLLKFH